MNVRNKLSNITGVYIEEVSIETPPYDDPNVLQEFVGRGVTREYMLQPAQEITGGKIQDFLDQAEDMVPLDQQSDRYRLKYNLLVRARAERGATAKARTYARLVNPFSPNVMRIRSVRETQRKKDIVSSAGPVNEFYDVTIITSK